MDKNLIREEMKKKRRMLTAEEITRKSESICNTLFMQEQFVNTKTAAVYLSSFREVDTAEIVKRLFEQNKRVVVPVSNTDTETITLSYLDSLSELKKGAYGILEPETVKPVDENEPDLIIVPGIAFDRQCRRIGFGKGYYDKLLKSTQAFTVGLCYEFQLLGEIPADSHDIPMDMVITEKQILRR